MGILPFVGICDAMVEAWGRRVLLPRLAFWENMTATLRESSYWGEITAVGILFTWIGLK